MADNPPSLAYGPTAAKTRKPDLTKREYGRECSREPGCYNQRQARTRLAKWHNVAA